MQPFADTPPWYGNPPDEPSRFKVAQFICKYGRLPNGFDPEIRIAGYGVSYGFYTMLPYIVQGLFMRFVSLFTTSEVALLYAARFVDVSFFGGPPARGCCAEATPACLKTDASSGCSVCL